MLKFCKRLKMACSYYTWDGRKWARWESDQNYCLDWPAAWQLAKVLVP